MPGPERERRVRRRAVCLSWHQRGGGCGHTHRSSLPTKQAVAQPVRGQVRCLLLKHPVASHCSAVGPQKGGGTQKKGREAGLLFRGVVFSHPPHFFWLPSSRPPLPSLRAPHPARTPAQCAPVMKVRPPGARQGTRRVGVSLGGMGAHHDAHPPAQKRSARAARPPATPISRSRRGRAVERRSIGVPAGPGARRQVLGTRCARFAALLRFAACAFRPPSAPPRPPRVPGRRARQNPPSAKPWADLPCPPPRCTS